MSVLTLLSWFRSFCFLLAFGSLVLAVFTNSQNVTDNLTATSLHSANQQVATPPDPRPVIELYVHWMLQWAAAGCFLQAIIGIINWKRQKHADRIVNRVLEADHPLRPQLPMRGWNRRLR